MAQYQVGITQTFTQIITVDAENEERAEQYALLSADGWHTTHSETEVDFVRAVATTE